MAISRREAFGSLAVLLELAATVHAQAPQDGAALQRQVFKHDLPNVSLDGWEVSVNHVDYAPGRVGQSHQHRGFLFAYVVEGEVIAQIIGDGVPNEERHYKVGEMFYEPMGSTHQVSKNASATKPARLLAVSFAKKG